MGRTIQAVDKQFVLNGPGGKLAAAFKPGELAQK